MLNIEKTLETQFPAWFSGRRERLTRPLSRQLGRWMGVDNANAFLTEYGHLTGLTLVDEALRYFGCRYLVDNVEREHIPSRGRVIIASNHPLGGLDSLLLLKLVGDIRPDVKILANDILLSIHQMQELLLPVRIIGGGQTSPASCRRIIKALENEQALIIFPAGEVSRLSPRGIRDRRWHEGFLRFAAHTGAPIVPVHVKASNSPWFYAASLLARPLGTMMLPRQMFRRAKATRAPVRIGAPICAPEKQGARDLRRLSKQIRQRVYALGRNKPLDDEMPLIAAAEDPRRLLQELSHAERIGQTADGKTIFVCRPGSDSALMREIGRLREFTFRAVGEGTGKARDIDYFDMHYDHIVLWDEDNMEIAGAYRLADCKRTLTERGLNGLYTATLFKYSPEMLQYLENAVELGRSFVQPKYWGSRSLDYLWYGIGAYLKRYPKLRYLVGPVSISGAEPPQARDWLVAYYNRYFGAEQELAEAHQPFAFNHAEQPDFGQLDAENSFKILKENLKRFGSRVPTLYKQYTELCEPGGARFLAFGVDPDFSNSVDGLILVDLERIRPNKRKRYLEGHGADNLHQMAQSAAGVDPQAAEGQATVPQAE